MRNWSIDTSKFDKNSESFIIWRLEQLINFGLSGEKIDKNQLRTYFPSLTLSPDKKRFMQFLLSYA